MRRAPSWRSIRRSWHWWATARTACRSGGRIPGSPTPPPTLTGTRRWPRRSLTTSGTAAAGTRSGCGTATGTPSGWRAARPASRPGRARPAVRRHRAGRDRGAAGRAARGHPGRLRRRPGRGRGDLGDAHHGRPRDRRRGTRQPGDDRAVVQRRQPRHHRMAAVRPGAAALRRGDGGAGRRPASAWPPRSRCCRATEVAPGCSPPRSAGPAHRPLPRNSRPGGRSAPKCGNCSRSSPATWARCWPRPGTTSRPAPWH